MEFLLDYSFWPHTSRNFKVIKLSQTLTKGEPSFDNVISKVVVPSETWYPNLLKKSFVFDDDWT